MEFWLIILFLLLSAYFSGSETVFLSVNRIRLEGFIRRGRMGARDAHWFFWSALISPISLLRPS